MNRQLRIRHEAVHDAIEAFSWYEAERPGLGREFEEALGSTLDLLRQVPEAGPIVHRDVRRVVLRRFPYAVYYVLSSELIDVRAVAHTHRDPGHWKKRA